MNIERLFEKEINDATTIAVQRLITELVHSNVTGGTICRAIEEFPFIIRHRCQDLLKNCFDRLAEMAASKARGDGEWMPDA